MGELKEHWARDYARFGLASLSLVYLLTGGLTARAALGLGGETVDAGKVFPFLLRQPFGRAVVGVLVLGLIGYILWRLMQAYSDPGGYGHGPKGLAIRAGYLISAGIYAALAFYAGRMVVLGHTVPRKEGATTVANATLDSPTGTWGLHAIALGLAIAACVQFGRVITGRFLLRIRDKRTLRRHHASLEISGGIGFTARGIVLGVMAYLFWRAGQDADAREARGLEGVWEFLAAVPYGSVLLAVVAGGLATYGVFLGIQASAIQDDLFG